VNEDTLLLTRPLPYGQEWAWHADANIVVLAPHLCPEERERALTEVQAHWRRSCLRVVGADDEASQAPTVPMTVREIVGSPVTATGKVGSSSA